MAKEFKPGREFAESLDKEDPLCRLRSRFNIPLNNKGEEIVYFVGNSLGLQPEGVRDSVEGILGTWSGKGVEGWFEGKPTWLEHQEVLKKLTAPIVGAKESEVTVMNSLTVNLHLLMCSFYRPLGDKHKIIIEKGAFPSDQYAVKSQLEFHGYDPAEALIEIEPDQGELISLNRIKETIESHANTAAMMLIGGINYYTGQKFNLKEIAKCCRDNHVVFGVDLAHAAGNIELNLHEDKVDFASWCNYKYLNGGPGAIGSAFIHENHHGSSRPRLAGWWGNDLKTRFDMGPNFDAAAGADGWQVSTTPQLLLAALRPALEIFDEVGMQDLRKKSVLLTDYLEFVVRAYGEGKLDIITPGDSEERGAQLSLSFRDAGRECFEKLIQNNVFCDWREPNVIRLAPVPMYNSFVDIYRFGEVIKSICGE